MKENQYTIVSVAFPVAISGLYDYKIPDNLINKIECGTPVLVDVKNRKIWGIAIEFKDKSPCQQLKYVLDIKKESFSTTDASLIKLYNWISSYYNCNLGRVFRPFVRKGIIKIKPKEITYYRVIENSAIENLTKKQRETFLLLKKLNCEITTDTIKTQGISLSLVSALIRKGLLEKYKKSYTREAEELKEVNFKQDYNIKLTQEQQNILDIISKSFSKNENCRPFLLHGITGSGKTHIYIELVKKVLSLDKGAIILVPEISLTPQTINRFAHALGGDLIAVIHSRMSEGERHDSINSLITGKKRIVIGVRSAILVPVHNLGLIIVDEEHDMSYKQSDPEPRYNARDVAVMRAKMQNAVIVLGSATPSLESYYNAITKKYELLRLTTRFGEAALPKVTIVDMCKEHRENNWSILSRYLKQLIEKALFDKRQVILLLNRRGFSTHLICKDCGYTYKCPKCSVNLIYHKNDFILKCHQCGYLQKASEFCLKCNGHQIKFKGTGIQKVEEYIASQFPNARILRMDLDTTRKKGGHIEVIKKFENREADILIGTQMVSKGLNFPGVMVVGVLNADIGLHFPDFRASEKTFQLLSQVAGRAGRADSMGEVVIQTYFPNDVAIKSAKEHDYVNFYNSEIVERKKLGYPPFTRLIRILVSGTDIRLVKEIIGKITEKIKKQSISEVTILGPAPAMLEKIDNEYRYNILLKSQSSQKLKEAIKNIKMGIKISSKCKMIIDVDPVNML